MQVVERLGQGNIVIKPNDSTAYNLYWKGRDDLRQHGVGILIKRCNYIKIIDVELYSPRILIARPTIHNINLKIIVIYAPHENLSSDLKNAFYNNLANQFKKDINNKKQKLMVIGDFNASIIFAKPNCSYSGSKHLEDTSTNDNGSRLLEFCRDNNLCISNTWFTHKVSRKMTFLSADGKTRKTLDYILCEKWIQQYMTNCRVKNGLHINSDHKTLVATMKTPYNKKARFKYCCIDKRPRKIDLKALTSTEVKQKLLFDFNKTLVPSNPTSTADEICSNLLNKICLSEIKSLPKNRNDKLASVWENDAVLNNHIDNLIAMSKNKAKHRDQISVVKKSITKKKRFLKN